jgi:hypothetical protein
MSSIANYGTKILRIFLELFGMFSFCGIEKLLHTRSTISRVRTTELLRNPWLGEGACVYQTRLCHGSGC